MTAYQDLLDIHIRHEISLADFRFDGFSAINEAVAKLMAGELKELFIVGDYGAGKTHLATAIYHSYTQQTRQTAISLSLKDLIHQDPNADALVGLDMFDLVIIDDLQYIRHSYEWQTGLFDLINKVREQQKQMLFLADNPAQELAIGLPDLITRLSLSPLLEIPVFDHEQDRDKLLSTILKHKNLRLPDEIYQHLLLKGPRNAGDIIAVITAIVPKLTLLKKQIPKKTINETKELIDKQTFLLELTNHGQTDGMHNPSF